MLKGNISAAMVGGLFLELGELKAGLAEMQQRLDEASRGSAELEQKVAGEMQGTPEWHGEHLPRADLERRVWSSQKAYNKLREQLDDRNDALYVRVAKTCEVENKQLRKNCDKQLAEARSNYKDWLAQSARENLAKLEQCARQLAKWKTEQLKKEVRS